MNKELNGIMYVNQQLIDTWKPAFESVLGADVMQKVPANRVRLMTSIAQQSYAKMQGATEAGMAIMTPNNTQLAMNVINPVAGTHNEFVSQQGTKGSADRQFLVGICVALAAKTIGLDLVQTVPATSANITINYLNVVYNGGDLNNAANNTVKVVTISFDKLPGLTAGTKYVIGHQVPNGGATDYEFIELEYVKPDRAGAKFAVFTVGNAFTATNTSGTLTNVTYVAPGPAIGALAADGAVYSIAADMSAITALTSGASIESIANTKAVDNYIPHQTTKGLNRTLTRSEADAGTDHKVELDLSSEAHVIGNRTFIGNISRLQYKRLQEQGIDAIPYLTAGMKNEVSQEINYQIVSAARAYGITNAINYRNVGQKFDVYIGPANVASVQYSTMPYAGQLVDKDGNSVAKTSTDVLYSATIPNLIATMQFETVASVGTYICMLITEAAYAIGTDSRFGEADAVVVSASIAGYLAASANFTKLSDKDVDMNNGTGAKLSGYINGIKVYVDVQAPINSPYITVLRTGQDVKVDVPGVDNDIVLIPGLVYLVKDLISTVDLIPSGTGGHKLILDSETDLIEVGNPGQAEKAYITFAVYINIPGLN